MTLRTLIKHLHALAGEMGADTPVEVRGLSRRVKVLMVKPRDDVAVIQVATRMTKAEKDNRQLGYFRARYKKLRAAGKCVRCTEPVPDGKGECAACAAVGNAKRKHRYQNQNT